MQKLRKAAQGNDGQRKRGRRLGRNVLGGEQSRGGIPSLSSRQGARCAREERAGSPHPPACLAFGQKVPGIGQRRAGVVVRQNFGVAPPGRRQGVRSTLTHPHAVAVPSDGKNDLPSLHRD